MVLYLPCSIKTLSLLKVPYNDTSHRLGEDEAGLIALPGSCSVLLRFRSSLHFRPHGQTGSRTRCRTWFRTLCVTDRWAVSLCLSHSILLLPHYRHCSLPQTHWLGRTRGWTPCRVWCSTGKRPVTHLPACTFSNREREGCTGGPRTC